MAGHIAKSDVEQDEIRLMRMVGINRLCAVACLYSANASSSKNADHEVAHLLFVINDEHRARVHCSPIESSHSWRADALMLRRLSRQNAQCEHTVN